jgi:hypothetical protein
MTVYPSRLTLTVDSSRGTDEEDRAELARRLRQALFDSDVDAVEFAETGQLPVGAKGDPASLYSVIVSIAPAAVTALAATLQLWLSRHDRAVVTVESGGEKLSLTGTLSNDQRDLVEAFLKRHKAAASDG